MRAGCHVNSHGVHANGPTGVPSTAGLKSRRSFVLTSTFVIAPRPDHAIPRSTTVPRSTKRLREIASGKPGGFIAARTDFWRTGRPESLEPL